MHVFFFSAYSQRGGPRRHRRVGEWRVVGRARPWREGGGSRLELNVIISVLYAAPRQTKTTVLFAPSHKVPSHGIVVRALGTDGREDVPCSFFPLFLFHAGRGRGRQRAAVNRPTRLTTSIACTQAFARCRLQMAPAADSFVAVYLAWST